MVIASVRFSDLQPKAPRVLHIFSLHFSYCIIISTGSYFVHLLLNKFSFPPVIENPNILK